MSELVHLDVDAGVATITLDSPANRNALSAQLRRELLAHLDTALADDAARVVVLGHTGRVFCSGMDLKEARGAGAADQGVNEVPAILQRIWTAPKPVVAKIGGPARAGGVGLVAACDIAVAATAATFAFSEVRIGVIPAVISVTVLPRLLPRAAHELFLTGETFDAARAVAVGLRQRGGGRRGARRRGGALRRDAAARRARAPSRRPRRCCAPAARRRWTASSPRCSRSPPGSSRARRARRACAAFAEKRPPRWALSGAGPQVQAGSRPGKAERAVQRRRVAGHRDLGAEPAAVAAHARDGLDAREHGRGERLGNGERLPGRPRDVPPVQHELRGHHRSDRGGGHRTAAERRVALPRGRVLPGAGRPQPRLRPPARPTPPPGTPRR